MPFSFAYEQSHPTPYDGYFAEPPAGRDAAWSRMQPYPDKGEPALEAAFVVGNAVVQALLDGWSQYRQELPRADGT